MIKGSSTQQAINIWNYVHYIIGAPKYKEKILTALQEEIDSNTITVWDFNIPFISMDRQSSQKSNKETLALNDRLTQMDLTHI